jgi:hypothetical protein
VYTHVTNLRSFKNKIWKEYKMKKFVLVVLAAALFLGIGIQNASADNGLKQGTFALGVSTDTDMVLRGKYLLASDLALTGGLGLVVNGRDNKGTDIALEAGVRKYLKVADFAPFVGGVIGIASTNDSNTTDFALYAEGGAEYFLSRHFSFEGAVRFGYSSQDNKAPVADTSRFGTSRASIGANFYF